VPIAKLVPAGLDEREDPRYVIRGIREIRQRVTLGKMGKSTAFTEGVLDLIAAGAQALAPAIWPFEVADALLLAERRKRITVAQVTELLGRILQLPVSVESVEPDIAFKCCRSRVSRSLRNTVLLTWSLLCGTVFPWPLWTTSCGKLLGHPASP